MFKNLPGFSNILDPENCQFWIDQNLTRTARFQRRMRDYLTNSNSPTNTTKVERIRNRLLKLVACTLVIIYEVDSHVSNPWSHAQPTHTCSTRAWDQG
jgi:hypothetical protein